MAQPLFDQELTKLVHLAQVVGFDDLRTRLITVCIDEMTPPTQRSSSYRNNRIMTTEMEEWLTDSARIGSFQHTERKFFEDGRGGYGWNRSLTSNHAGYRHFFMFTNPDTAFEFKLRYGRGLLNIAESKSG
ncbi:MAG: hypothetical protein EOP83_09965 [Verrucomicrobiaceae bacterium]|nr:MAG: hypothetical protein EOP83_09965 [Verrucomicrobiaceae bacterium]